MDGWRRRSIATEPRIRAVAALVSWLARIGVPGSTPYGTGVGCPAGAVIDRYDRVGRRYFPVDSSREPPGDGAEGWCPTGLRGANELVRAAHVSRGAIAATLRCLAHSLGTDVTGLSVVRDGPRPVGGSRAAIGRRSDGLLGRSIREDSQLV